MDANNYQPLLGADGLLAADSLYAQQQSNAGLNGNAGSSQNGSLLGPALSFDSMYSEWISDPTSGPPSQVPQSHQHLVQQPQQLHSHAHQLPNGEGGAHFDPSIGVPVSTAGGNGAGAGTSIDANLFASLLAAGAGDPHGDVVPTGSAGSSMGPPLSAVAAAALSSGAAGANQYGSLGGAAPAQQNLADFFAAVQNASSTSAAEATHVDTSAIDHQLLQQGDVIQPPPAPATKNGKSSRGNQADSTVPEAALHLLRLALPSSGPGTATTVSSGEGHDEDELRSDDDGEGESDNTSLLSEPGVRRMAQLAKKNGKARAAAAAAMADADASAVNGTFGPLQVTPSINGNASGSGSGANRRTSGRVRKNVLVDGALLDNNSDDSSDGGEDDNGDDAFEAPYHLDSDGEVQRKGKGKGKAKPAVNKGKGRAGSVSSATSASNQPLPAIGEASAFPLATASGSETPLSTPAAPTKKGKRASTGGASPAPKKPRVSTPSGPRRPRRVAAPVTVPPRTFPATVQMDLAAFPRMYRTFPVSSAFPPDSYVHRLRALPDAPATSVVFMQPPVDSKWNKACDPFNLYAPKFVKGLGDDKCGMCPICAESVERGGEGVERWLKLKNSSFVYHMSYAHGLSNLTGLPFSPPVQLRTNPVHAPTKDARDHMTEGLCHKCNEWIPLLSVKNVEAVVPELIWWKHAKPCHGSTAIPGEGDYYILDDVYELVVSRKSASGAASTSASAQPHQQAQAMVHSPFQLQQIQVPQQQQEFVQQEQQHMQLPILHQAQQEHMDAYPAADLTYAPL